MNDAAWDRLGAAFERIVSALVRAREVDPALAPFPEPLDPFFEEIRAVFVRADIEKRWPDALDHLGRLGAHPLARYVDCRRALEGAKPSAVLAAAREAATELAAGREGKGPVAVAELLAFECLLPVGLDLKFRRFQPDVAAVTQIFDQLDAATGSVPIHHEAAALRARDEHAAHNVARNWRAGLLTGFGSLSPEKDDGGH